MDSLRTRLSDLREWLGDVSAFHPWAVTLAALAMIAALGGGAGMVVRARRPPAPPPLAASGPAAPTLDSPAAGGTPPGEAGTLGSQLQRTAEQGDWPKVDEMVFQARKQAEKDSSFLAIAKEAAAPLQVDCSIHAALPRGRPASPAGTLKLSEGDEYWLQLGFSTRCYLYVFEQDSSARLRVLFPNPTYSSLANPVEGQARIPEDYSKPFVVAGGTPGMHTIHVLAARWQQKRLEELIARGLATAGPDALSFLNAAKEHTANIAGLSYGTYQFQQETGSAPANLPASAKL